MRKKFLVILILLAVVTVAVLAVVLVDPITDMLYPARGLYETALEFYEKKDHGSAIEKAEMLISQYPDSVYASKAKEVLPSWYYEWALALTKEGKFDEALQKYWIVLEEYTEYAAVYWSIMVRDADLEQPPVVTGDMEGTLLTDIPADVLFNSAAQLSEAEEYDKAIMLYNWVVWYHPESRYATDADKAAIETEIEKIYKEEHSTFSLPMETKKELGGICEVTIINDSPYELIVLLSGPATMSITIDASPNSDIKSWAFIPSLSQPPEAAERETFTLAFGNYKVAFKVSDAYITPSYGEWPLTSDTSYRLWFYITEEL